MLKNTFFQPLCRPAPPSSSQIGRRSVCQRPCKLAVWAVGVPAVTFYWVALQIFRTPFRLLRSHPALQFTHLDLVEPLGRGIETRTSLESGISSKDLPAPPTYFFFDKTFFFKESSPHLFSHKMAILLLFRLREGI